MDFSNIENDLTQLKIGQPAARALASIRVTKLTDLTNYSEKELMALHGFGPKALRLLIDALEKEGLRLLP